ncbi:MAG: hypothetical protein LBQ54_08410, partial [Planctomycetaceae bacterium]|nr:hypothetical protein [Planctomycetaceae bacterium]
MPLHRSCLRLPLEKFFHLKATAPKVLGAYWDPTPSRWPTEGSIAASPQLASGWKRYPTDGESNAVSMSLPPAGASRPAGGKDYPPNQDCSPTIPFC